MKTCKNACVFLMVLLMATAVPCVAQASADFVGDYAGMSGPLHVMLHLKAGPGGALSGTVDSPQQNMYALPCSDLKTDGQSLSFKVPNVRGSWTGFIGSDGKSLTGTWTQGSPMPLNLTRVGAQESASTGPTAPPSQYVIPAVPKPTVSGDSCPAGMSASYWDGSAWKPMKQATITKGKAGLSAKETFKHLDTRAGTTAIVTLSDFTPGPTLAGTPKFCFNFYGQALPYIYVGVLDVKNGERSIELKQSRSTGANNMVPLKKFYELPTTQIGDRSISAASREMLPSGMYVVSDQTERFFEFSVP